MANELRVLTNFLGGLIDDDPLTSGATAFNSAALVAAPVIDSTHHMPIVLDPDGLEGPPEIVWMTAHAASATSATILRAQEIAGATATQHSKNIPWVHAATILDLSRVHKFVRRTTGDVSSNTTAWGPMVGDGSLDIVLAARVGDVLEVGMGARWNNEATFGRADVAIVNGATILSTMSGGDLATLSSGVPWWLGVVSTYTDVGGPVHHTVQSGDLVGGTVTLRPYMRVDDAGVSKTIPAMDHGTGSVEPLEFWVKNLGSGV